MCAQQDGIATSVTSTAEGEWVYTDDWIDDLEVGNVEMHLV